MGMLTHMYTGVLRFLFFEKHKQFGRFI